MFRTTVWNNSRGRKQRNKELPTGVPEHIYNFPENYGGMDCSLHVNEDQLTEAAALSGVFSDETEDYLRKEVRLECERHVPNPEGISTKDVDTAFIYLKEHFDCNRV